MSQTILIEPTEKLRDIFKINLTTYTGTDIVERNSAKDTIALLKILPTIDLIICRSEVELEKTALEIHQFLADHNMQIPLIILGKSIEEQGQIQGLEDPFTWEDLVQKAKKLLGIDNKLIDEDLQPNYLPIGVQYFFDIDHTPCDVYIRLKKSNSDFKFVKRLNEQDSFTSEDIQKYIDQGLKDFYIPKDYQQYFVTFVTNAMIKKMEEELLLKDRLTVNSNAYGIIKEHIRKMGGSPEISELAEANINSMLQSVTESTNLATLLKMILTSKMSYAYQKAHIVCVLGNFILSKQSWFEKRHLEFFTYLSFFADITLKSNTQMKISSTDELDTSNLSPKEKVEVLNHALNASVLTKDFPHKSDYLELIVKQHQGSLDGIGFSSPPDEEIHPLAKVFIIADAFVKMMLDPVSPQNKKDILTILYMQFPISSYQKIIKLLEQKIE